MATINVKDSAGSVVALEKPLTPGATTASASRPVTLATDDALVTATGAIADAIVAAGASGSVSAKLRRATQGLEDLKTLIVLAAGTNAIGKLAANAGVNVGTVSVDATQLAAALSAFATLSVANGQQVCLPTDQPWPKGLSNRAISAAFTTLTRPANTTAYTAGDSISNNATAGSVTALTATLGDVNDDPVFLSEILITSTDTGLAGKRVRAYIYNSDPTASSGVSGGDNAAFSNKVAGYIGSFSGRLEAGFSDGTVGRLVPSFQLAADTTDLAGAPAGGFIPTKPTSGAKTLFIQFQAIDAFTPSASSTTIIATARGWQARAA